ncbi:hypothetical protein H0X09_02290 [Candidatus Saccharibacteria bacterium]|nr:hypothetical protein [Candidatus Saccharibacteria bacterium]
MTHHVIYVPGLGDRTPNGQNLAIQLWRLYGLTPHYFPLRWADKEKLSLKIDRLLSKIDELSQQDHPVSLVGVSAGASAVLNAYSNRKNLGAVVSIVGKIHNPQTIGGTIYKINPAFKESMYLVASSLDKLGEAERARILSLYTPADRTVPPFDSQVLSGVNRKIFGFGHISGIFFAVIFGGPSIAAFIRKHADRK